MRVDLRHNSPIVYAVILAIAMILVLWAFVFVMSPPARADRIDNSTPEELCKAYRIYFIEGMRAKYAGTPYVIRYVTPSQMQEIIHESIQGHPRYDAIYAAHQGWNERETRFFEEAVADGYDRMDEFVSGPEEPDWDAIESQLSDECEEPTA